MSYLGLETVKPIKPMKRGDLYSFPITTIDQIVTDEETNERLSEYLDKNFGMDLLWQNASVNSSFGAQKITFTQNDCTHYMILPSWTTDATPFPPTVIPVGASGYIGGVASGQQVSRTITASDDSSITFSGGHGGDAIAIPYQVIGLRIKGA